MKMHISKAVSWQKRVILSEKKNIPLEILLQMATINGAKALNWDDMLGSFEKGKQPGITLLSNDLRTSRRIL